MITGVVLEQHPQPCVSLQLLNPSLDDSPPIPLLNIANLFGPALIFVMRATSIPLHSPLHPKHSFNRTTLSLESRQEVTFHVT